MGSSLEEIERSIEEMGGQNFFLALIGDRYGWTPAADQLSDHLASRYVAITALAESTILS